MITITEEESERSLGYVKAIALGNTNIDGVSISIRLRILFGAVLALSNRLEQLEQQMTKNEE